MKRNLLISFTCLASIGVAAQTKLSVNEMKNMYKSSNNTVVSIHDPSIVYNNSDNTYYIIGSHSGLASSSKLISFNGLNNSSLYNTTTDKAFIENPAHSVQVTRNGVTTTETLGSFNAAAFCSTYSQISMADWVSGNMWAPDMIYNPNMKKWCMYLSLNGDNWASVVIMLTADSPKGPFTYQAPIVFSGFNGQTYSNKSVSYKDTDLELVLGEQASLPSRYRTNAWGNLWPNCIDPCVFFDESGELWMTYGSWSGGIFIMRLNKDTGLRDYTYTYPSTTYSGKAPNGASYTGYSSDPYFGKLIAGGAYVSGEGSYIEKIGNYYYLFMSYGGFDPDKGYEMRIFRSEKPDGPYKDALGSVATFPSYVLNYGKNATSNKGMKIIGAMNNWGTMTVGECAQGHNSAIVDNEGDAFVVYHTKFNNGTYGHLVRTRQLFVNEKGWLVASPFNYTGKQTTQSIIESRQLFTPDSVAGVYKLLIHPYRLDHSKMAEATPVTVTLTADGKITGERIGTWAYSEEGKSFVNIKINDITYYGVALDQNVDGYADMPAMCFSAVSNSGVPIWLYKYQPKAAVASAYRSIVTDYLTSSNTISTSAPVIENVTSTFTATNVETKEPDTETLSESGVFTPTEDGHRISISIKLESGSYYYTAGPYIKYTAKKDEQPSSPVYYPVSANKNTTSAWWSNFSTKDYSLSKGEEAEFQFYNYSNKRNNWNNWCLYGANTTHGGNGYTEYFGIRCDNWDNTSSSNNGCTSNFNWDTFKDDMDQSLVRMTVSYSESGIFTMKSTITTKSGKVYNYSFTKTIPNSPSSLTMFFVNEGSYIDGSDIPTGITQPQKVSKPAQNTRIYNMFGQQVDDNYRGVRIINGRKYINKEQ